MFPFVGIVATAGGRGCGDDTRVRLHLSRLLQSLLQEHLRRNLYWLLHEFRTTPAIQRHLEVRWVLLRHEESLVHAAVSVEVCQIVACVVTIVPAALEEYPAVVAGE